MRKKGIIIIVFGIIININCNQHFENSSVIPMEIKCKQFYKLEKQGIEKYKKAKSFVQKNKNGTIISKEYNSDDGKIVGISTDWFDNGQIKQEGIWSKSSDTIIINDSIFVFINPFPNVHLQKYFSNDTSVFLDSIPKKNENMFAVSYDGWTTEWRNEKQMHYTCIGNEKDGTLLRYWREDKGRPIFVLASTESITDRYNVNGVWQLFILSVVFSLSKFILLSYQ